MFSNRQDEIKELKDEIQALQQRVRDLEKFKANYDEEQRKKAAKKELNATEPVKKTDYSNEFFNQKSLEEEERLKMLGVNWNSGPIW